ncbi:MAG: adhesin, partial [Methanobrevibacter sp.]|nr:adhesin [Methanobrevibacter sp.]
VTLKDSNGTAIADKTIQAALNGKIYKLITDSQGKAALQISLAKANTYTCAFAFLGDSKYPASALTISKLTVTKKSTSLSASVKSNKVTVTLKTSKNKYDSKKYLNKGKKITLKVKGKTYSLKTNAKGIVKFTLKLAKGTYTAKISFTGDSTYKSSAKTVKIRIR